MPVLTLDDYQERLRKVARLKSKADRVQGALDETYSSLKSRFGYSSLKEAKAALNKLLDEEIKAARAYAKAVERFDAEFGEVLKDA